MLEWFLFPSYQILLFKLEKEKMASKHRVRKLKLKNKLLKQRLNTIQDNAIYQHASNAANLIHSLDKHNLFI